MFHVVRDGKRFGPYSVEQLRKLLATSKLHDFDLVMRVGETETRLLTEIPELQGVRVPAAPGHTPAASRSPQTHAGSASREVAEQRPTMSSLGSQILSGGKVAAAVGTVAGFIGDFLEPLAPINSALFLVTMIASVVLGYLWFRLPGEERLRFDRWFPQQSMIFSSFLLVAFGGWFLLQRVNAEPERGLLGGNITLVAQAQDALLQLKQDVVDIKEDVAVVKQTTTDIQRDTTAIRDGAAGIHADTSAIREGVAAIGKLRGVVASPGTAADHYHNAMVHVRDGNHAAAEESFAQYFRLEHADMYDPYEQYAGLILGNYAPERAKRMLSTLAEQHPGSLSARLVAITETTDGGAETRDQIVRLLKQHPEYLPAYIALYDLVQPGLLFDDMTRSEIQMSFELAGGVEALKSYILNPAEGVGEGVLERGAGFGRKEPIDPMERLLVGMRADPDITLLWLGVDDTRPGKELQLTFPGGNVVRLPLDSPDNPASYAAPGRVPQMRARGSCVALELPRGKAPDGAIGPAFVPRSSDDIRIFPHAGQLTGVAIGVAIEVQVAYIDAVGRTVRFPKPVKLFSDEDDGVAGLFTAEISRHDTFDPTPVLHITPAVAMRRVEVSGRADGPFVEAPFHVNVPTKRELPCAAVPFFAASRGVTRIWIRGETESGREVSSQALGVDVPQAVRWKTQEPAPAQAGDAGAAPVVLNFERPNTYTDYYIDTLAFSPNGKRLAAMMVRAGVVVWDVTTGRQTHLVVADPGKTLVFSTDGTRVTNGCDIIDLERGTKTSCLPSDADRFGVAVSASFAVAATIDRRQRLAVYDFPAGAETAAAELGPDHHFPCVVAISPDTGRIAVGGEGVNAVWLVDSRSGKVQKQFVAPHSGFTSLAFSPDGTHLLAAGDGSQVRLWELATGKECATRFSVGGHSSPVVTWTNRGIPLVADLGPADLTLTDVHTGKPTGRIYGSAKKFAISAAGDMVAMANKTTITVRRLD